MKLTSLLFRPISCLLSKTLLLLNVFVFHATAHAQHVVVESDCDCVIDMRAYSWEDQYNMVYHALHYLNPYDNNIGSSDMWELVKITFTINSDPWMFLSWDYMVDPDEPFRQVYGPVICNDEPVGVDFQGGRTYQSGPPYTYQFKVTCFSPDYNPVTQDYDLCD